MSRGVEPKKVAPLIRGARYTFLIAGWFYGVSKKTVYTKIEAIARPKRKAALEEEHRLHAKQQQEKSIEELKALFQILGFEPEADWEKSI